MPDVPRLLHVLLAAATGFMSITRKPILMTSQVSDQALDCREEPELRFEEAR
jgi:hypothetical protein